MLTRKVLCMRTHAHTVHYVLTLRALSQMMRQISEASLPKASWHKHNDYFPCQQNALADSTLSVSITLYSESFFLLNCWIPPHAHRQTSMFCVTQPWKSLWVTFHLSTKTVSYLQPSPTAERSMQGNDFLSLSNLFLIFHPIYYLFTDRMLSASCKNHITPQENLWKINAKMDD